MNSWLVIWNWIVNLFWWSFDHFTPLGIAAAATVTYAVFAILQWRAISRQSDALVSLESPKVFFRDVDEVAGAFHPRAVHLVLENYGRTRAFIDEINIDIIARAKLPRNPDYAPDARLPPEQIFHAMDTDKPFNVTPHFEVTMDELDGVNAQRLRLWVYGRIVYHDLFNYEHIRGFCGHFRRLNAEGQQFISHGFFFGGPRKYVYYRRHQRK